MKPNFALKLSHDGLEILQRAASGWVLTGSIRFDSADLDGALRQLRLQAEGLAPDGVRSKLIMPAGEVRYATVMAPGPTDEARRLQIEAEIEGLTPYALHELAYDYGVEGDHALVAICARDILAEAEEFAQTHGFNPVSLVAIPPSGAFIGEPFFGETSCARAFLAPTDLVKRDSEPVRLASTPKPAAAPPRPAPPAAALATPAAPAAPAGRAAASVAAAAPEAFSRVGSLVRRMGTRIRREQAQAATDAPPAKPAQPPVAPQTPPATATTPAARAPEAPRPPMPKADAPRADAPKTETAKTEAAKAGAAAMPPQAPARPDQARPEAARQAPATPPSAPPKPASATLPASTAKAATPPAGNAKAAAPTGPARAVNGRAPEGRPADNTPAQGAASNRPNAEKAAQVAFASRRSPAAPTPTRPAGPGPALVSSTPGARADKPNPGGRIAVLPAGSEKERPGTMTRLYRRGRRATKGALVSIGLMKADENRGRRRRKAAAAAQAQPLVAASRPPADEREKATEAQALTIFGARNMQSSESSFARRGLMLTGGLILLLVAVAIWAVFFTSGTVNDTARDADLAQTPQQAITALPQIEPRADEPGVTPPSEIIAPAPVAPSTEEEDATAALPAPEDATPAPEPAPEQTTEQTTDPDVMLEELVQDALTQALPADLLGDTGDGAGSPAPLAEPGAPAGPGTTGTTEEAPFEGGDSPQIAPEGEAVPDQRLALPPVLERPELAEVLPVSPPAPPPFRTEFALGEDGLVEATPEGALTPTGVMVYARPPAAVPPARPAGLAPPPAAEEPEAQVAPLNDSGAAAVEAAVQAALEDAAEPLAEAAAEAASDTGAPDAGAVVGDDTPRADPALAGIRPQPRSPNVAAQAQDAATPETTTDPAPAPTPDPASEAVDTDDDNAALAPPPGGVSLEGLRPQRRPTDLVPPEETAAAEEVAPETDDSAREAVAVSLRPTARPTDMSARVQAALAAARTPAAAPAAAAAAPAAAAPAPAQTAAAAPNIPTSASVAQQATQARAINLRRVNLIGVFGTPNDRRALVRLSNGQVMRVQVGDRLDGGQVSAIGEDELRYVKNGRNEILRIGSSG